MPRVYVCVCMDKTRVYRVRVSYVLGGGGKKKGWGEKKPENRDLEKEDHVSVGMTRNVEMMDFELAFNLSLPR